MKYTKYKYQGDTPGNDTNDYVLFSSLELGTHADAEGNLQLNSLTRITVGLYSTQAGTLKAEWKERGGATWRTLVADQAVTAMTTGTDLIRNDYEVDDIDEFRLVWTHGGVEIGSGDFIVMLNGHHDRSIAT